MTAINNSKKVAVGLSGGVDSAVAAALLLDHGYDVTGVYMQCWDAKADGCRSDEDRAAAAANAAYLGIKVLHLDLIDSYKAKVIENFYSEYASGRTPNPDILCNKEIKFGLFYEWANDHQYDFIATGHYARNQGGALMQGGDLSKDQSYFLYRIPEESLSHTLFPIGAMTKKEVREFSAQRGLPSSSRAESMGICFIGEVNISDFLSKRFPRVAGKVLFKDGRFIGTHKGAVFYTIGQRHGFTVTEYSGVPLYVLSKNTKTNELIVGYQEDLYKKTFEVGDMFWRSPEFHQSVSDGNYMCSFRIRHLGEMYEGKLSFSSKSAELVEVTCISDKRGAFAPAPGQSAVFYHEEVVLGGGVIV